MDSIRTVDKQGTIRYKNIKGEFHREDGPAYENPNGYRVWYINGMIYREDGPAVIFSDGEEWYYLNGKEYSKEEWEQEVVKLKLGRIKDL
jgi:hypothetical protein